MPKISAGILMFRRKGAALQVFLAHPGGPFWAERDLGAWTIPKGLASPGEDLLAAARREFQEETGFATAGTFIPLTPVTLKSGKMVHAWALEGDCDPGMVRSNTFTMEWPPRSGKTQEFPEVDKAGWFELEEAGEKINPGQAGFLAELRRKIPASR